MCGRFVASRPVEDIARLLDVDEVDVPPELRRAALEHRSAGAGARRDTAAHEPGLRRLSVFRWGLVPWWAKDPSIGARAFNAKAETVADKPMFRSAVESQRCVVPADAFYEWAPARAGRPEPPQAALVLPAAGVRAALVGRPLGAVASPRRQSLRRPLRTCTILTTDANELVGRVHDRMPVLIAEDDLEEWLSPEPLAAGELDRLIRPAPPGVLEAFRVSTQVNDAREDGPELVEPLAADAPDEVDAKGSESGDAGAARNRPQLF